MLGKKELQERLAQRENALAQREAEISVLTKRVEELKSREARLHSELEGYRSRSEAIINALTEAQHTAARIREEADAYKTQVVSGAYSERDAAKREAEETLQKARLQAEQLLAKAGEQAAQIRSQAEAYVAEAKKRAAGLKERLRQAAEEARQQAEAFGSFAMDIRNCGTGSADVNAAALPKDYKSPSELMRNIYTIQGRELPQDGSGAQDSLQQPEPAPDLESILAEVVGLPDCAEAEPESSDGQVFSVNEILTSGAPAAMASAQSVGIPSGLDAIIDDILRGI